MMVTCPICRKETFYEGNPFRPFCSDRCRLVDLGMWAKEEYRIAGEKRDLAGCDSSAKKD